MIKSKVFLLVFVFALSACSKGTVSGTTGTQTQATTSSPTQASGNISFTAPDGWVVEKTTSNMRVAQYKLPKNGGDTEDGSLVLYYFGPGQGGSVLRISIAGSLR